MQLRIYSIRDAKAEIYNAPFFQKTHGEAERSFKTVANDPKSTVCQHPEDFDLWYLGTYDDQSGIIESLATPQHISKAVDMKN